MKLQEFIDKHVEHNTMVRLWTKLNNSHGMVEDDINKVYMNHDIRKTIYGDWDFLYVTNVLCNGAYTESINLVLLDPNPYRNFINNLRADEDMYRTYKDNIAMAFQDNFDEEKSLHENANNAADYFLKQLTK